MADDSESLGQLCRALLLVLDRLQVVNGELVDTLEEGERGSLTLVAEVVLDVLEHEDGVPFGDNQRLALEGVRIHGRENRLQRAMVTPVDR